MLELKKEPLILRGSFLSLNFVMVYLARRVILKIIAICN